MWRDDRKNDATPSLAVLITSSDNDEASDASYQAVTTYGKPESGLQGNGERMRKWRDREEMERE